MPLTPAQASQLAIFRTKPLGPDGQFVLGWQQFISSVVTQQANSPTFSNLTHAQRLALQTGSVNLGSQVFELDTNHLFIWNGKTWLKLI
jgi:hypothetical protein